MGVKRVSIPNRSTKSPARRREQKKRWFRNGQKWRTGCEGRISVVKRCHGLNRCRYKGEAGMKRWVGLGVIADNLPQHRPRYGKAVRPISSRATEDQALLRPAGSSRRVLLWGTPFAPLAKTSILRQEVASPACAVCDYFRDFLARPWIKSRS